MCYGFAIKGRTTINLSDDDQRKLCLWFIVPASNGERRSTARQTFEPECLIAFVLRTFREPIIRKRALHNAIEDKRSRDTESNWDIALSARRTCG